MQVVDPAETHPPANLLKLSHMTRIALLLLAASISSGAVVLADDRGRQRIVPSVPPGIYTVEQWKADWPGCVYEDGVKEQHLSLVITDAGPAFRVDYATGEIGPEEGGVGWRYPIARTDSAEVSYTLTFSQDFDWVKGGKLPGLCGGPESVTGGNPANGKNGFSARLMWRADGQGEAYVYHMHQPGNYGESFAFPSDFTFPTAASVSVRLRVALNTPGQRDGTLDVWIATPDTQTERHVLSRSDMQWRSDPSIAIDGLLFETFHGGGDKSWAPRRRSFTLFGDIMVSDLQPQHGGSPRTTPNEPAVDG